MSEIVETAAVAQARSARRLRLPSDWPSQLASMAVLALGALIMLLPFIWMVTTSLSRKANQSMPRVPSFWPADPSLFNYTVAAGSLPIGQYYLNSLIVVGLTTFGYLFFSAIAGYAFAKGRFP